MNKYHHTQQQVCHNKDRTWHEWFTNKVSVRLHHRIGFSILGNEKEKFEDTTNNLVCNASFLEKDIHTMSIQKKCTVCFAIAELGVIGVSTIDVLVEPMLCNTMMIKRLIVILSFSHILTVWHHPGSIA